MVQIIVDGSDPERTTSSRDLLGGGTRQYVADLSWKEVGQNKARTQFVGVSAVQVGKRFRDIAEDQGFRKEFGEGSPIHDFAINTDKQSRGARLCQGPSKKGVLQDFMPDSNAPDFGQSPVLASMLYETPEFFDWYRADVLIHGRFHMLEALSKPRVHFHDDVPADQHRYLTDLTKLLPAARSGAVFFHAADAASLSPLDLYVDLLAARLVAVQVGMRMAQNLRNGNAPALIMDAREIAVRFAAVESAVLSEFAQTELFVHGEGFYEIAREAISEMTFAAAESDAFVANVVRTGLPALRSKYRPELPALKWPVLGGGSSALPSLKSPESVSLPTPAPRPLREPTSPPSVARKEPDGMPTVDKAAFDAVMKELDGLVGLATVKREAKTLLSFARFEADRRRQRGADSVPQSLHLQFLGPPGTGKTTVARLVGRLYKSLGLLKSGHVVEVARSDLIGPHIGKSEDRTREKVAEALDGVLFIDEAYSLYVEDASNDFGRLVINELTAIMENNRDRLAIVVAGYKKEMEPFMRNNPGFASRFEIEPITFENYTADELVQIFLNLVKKDGSTITDEATAHLRERYKRLLAKKDPNFGNGRQVRNDFQRTLKQLALRHDPDGGDVDELITKQDVEQI